MATGKPRTVPSIRHGDVIRGAILEIRVLKQGRGGFKLELLTEADLPVDVARKRLLRLDCRKRRGRKT